MAWIKMRMDLKDHPKVVRIMSATDSDKFRVIGGLHEVWSTFDRHSDDGVLPGYTPRMMDYVVGYEGIAQAMIDVGWLVHDEAVGLVMPEFHEHNGKSAKRRAEDSKRKRLVRQAEERPEDVRKMSARVADKTRTGCGLEKEKEKEKSSSSAPAGVRVPARAPDSPPLAVRQDGNELPSDVISMYSEWKPDQELLKHYAVEMSIELQRFTPVMLMKFVVCHTSPSRQQTRAAWVAEFVRWVADNREREEESPVLKPPVKPDKAIAAPLAAH
jgi:hypothetical protein